MSGNERHLGEEMLFKAIIDESDLTPENRSHLLGCESCRLNKVTMEGDFSRFTSLAQEVAPEPRRRIRLDLKEAGRLSVRRVAPVFTLCIVLLIALAGLSSLMPVRQSEVKETAYTVVRLESEMEANGILVAEVLALEENIMPEIYSLLAGDGDAYEFDEFIDFVFPVEEETDDA